MTLTFGVDHAKCPQIDHLTAPKRTVNVDLIRGRRRRGIEPFPASIAVESAGEVTLGNIFSIERGLATGANEFFILTEAEIETWQIPHAFAKPILPGDARIHSTRTSG
jgi:hypothetical protein